MRLKQLEIYGFKTFPDKSVISFPSGISAVVGPNGCGKSNIFDAIKWVMGEQSIKQLRGKSMGDVIFAGTEKRPPLNYAEVSLVLANDGASAGQPKPLDPYTEVMITRRLYRSGESAYLLNNQPCRLKDIQNIFLGSGMGSKSCAIVQQGNIGAITEATAEERRSFIEEAAGVMRYKTRKKEALTKVETTRRNLERLDDIIDEIKQQLSVLSEQAETARACRRLKARLKEADIQVAVHYYLRYARQIETIESKLEELDQTDADQSETLEELSARLEKMRAESADRQAEVQRRQGEASEKQRRLDRLEADRDFRQQENERLFDELSDLEADYQQLIEKKESLAAEIAEEEEKEEQLKASIASIKETIEEEARKSGNAREELAALNDTLQEQQSRVTELSAYKAKYQNICQNAEANKDNVKKRIKRLNSEEAEAQKRIASLAGRQEDQNGRHEQLTSEREALQEEIEALRAEISRLNDLLSSQVKTVNSCRNERSRLRSRYSALKKMEDNYEWYRDGVKAVMKNRSAAIFQETGSPALLGTLADFITPDEGFELALEAFLGEALQFVLVEDAQAGIRVIQYLRENDAGRCGVMPVAPAVSEGEEGRTAAETPDGALLSVLSIAEGYEAPIRRLIGDARVAEDFEAAVKMRGSFKGATIVTKEGDRLDPDGVIIGGSAGKLTGIYEKKQEIRTLEHRIAELTDRITEEETAQSALESKIREIEDRLYEQTRRASAKENDLLQLEKDLYKTAEQLKHARRQHEIITLEKERLEGEKEDIETEIQSHDAALESVKQELAEAETAVSGTREKIAELSGRLKSSDQKEMDLKLEMTRLQAELDSSRSTLKRLRRFRQDSEDRIGNTLSEIEAKTEQRDSAAQAVQELIAVIDSESAELSQLSEAVRLEEKQYQALVKALKSTDNNISRTREILSRNQKERHQLELELSRLKLNQDNGVNRFLERYAESFLRYINEYQEVVDAPDFSVEQAEAERTECKKEIEALGDVNPGAIEAYENQKERCDFFIAQREDLVSALNDLQNVISRINRITQQLFMESFHSINAQFQELFPRLFEGGKAWLELTQPSAPLETGVELMIQPPGKRLSRLSLLSGGEKALSAIAFIFSIFLINPASYCLLDEIDAPLDDVNIYRFNELLRIIGENSQIIMITHNKKSMEFAEALYGVTMSESGVSRIVSVDLERILEKPSRVAVSANI
jgi:chromosome segregation protein